MELLATAHRRHNPLTGGWILVSPDRTDRPWQGAIDGGTRDARPAHDPDCYLCPGNTRAGGATNPAYNGTFVFTNDFPSLRPDTGEDTRSPSPLLRAQGQAGTCRVLCFHPRHDLTMARMTIGQVRAVVELWADQIEALSGEWAWVQVFENRGAQMGASNPHPHGQLWALSRLPQHVEVEDRQQRTSRDELGAPLLLHYAQAEASDGARVVVANDLWLVVVPFWAVWPFEALVLPRRHVRRLPELSGAERDALADVLRRLLVRYDNLFEHPFPYSMGWHGAPGSGGDDGHWQLHAHFYPPLLRSATVRKFMVGFEMLAEPQRDITAEDAAARLRDLPSTTWETRSGERVSSHRAGRGQPAHVGEAGWAVTPDRSARDRAVAQFHAHFGHAPEVVVRAPGRVNLIGEHTDYNEGYVLPMAIEYALWVAVAADSRVTLVSDNADGKVAVDPAAVGDRLDGWGAYVQGVVWALREAGHPVWGIVGAVASDVPAGAGLSSSAALEMAVCRAVTADADWDPVAAARVGRRAENAWVGVDSGILDQLSSAAARAGHALLIDCRSLAIDHVPLPDGVVVVIMDTAARGTSCQSTRELLPRPRRCAPGTPRRSGASSSRPTPACATTSSRPARSWTRSLRPRPARPDASARG